MEGVRIFISGGAGVIGQEMVPLLASRGAKILVGDLKPRPASFPNEVCYRQGDLNEMTTGELQAFSPEIFIHLAATFERSTESYDFWDENFYHNVRLSHHLMTLAKDLPSLRRVVFASSYLIYNQDLYQFDRAQESPVSLKETDPVMPRNLTGMAKLAHEIELQFLQGFRSAAFTSVCARIYRGYGRNSRDVISRWIRSLLQDQEITVYRAEGMFDYIYARDSAEGLIRLAGSNEVTGIINLGTGRARRVHDVLDILRQHFPGMRERHVEANIPFEASQANMTAYRAAIGWAPEYDLERAIPEIIEHERKKLAATARTSAAPGNVLVTSSSKKVPLVRAVKDAAAKLHPQIRVIAGDMDENALTRYVADDFWLMPRTNKDYLSALIAGCQERQIRTIIPTRDGELSFWSNHREEFARNGIKVIASPVESIEICLDKLAFSRFGSDKGLPFIPSGLTPEEVGPGPYVVKERYGAGSRQIGLGLGREAAVDHARQLSTPIYQPMVQGREISIDAYLDRSHRVKGLMLRSRDKVVDGESQITTTFRDPAIEARATQVLEALKLNGPVVLQAIIDERDEVHVIECNSRFGGASTAAIAAGLDVFYWSLLEASGADLESHPFLRSEREIRQIRLPSDIYVQDPDF